METNPSLDVRVRLAASVDAEAIASLLYASFVEYQSLYTPDGFAATVITTAGVTSRMAEGPIWVAVSAETIVGAVSVVTKEDSLYIRGMAVLPTARGQRIGELLLSRIEEYAATQNCVRMLLSTTPFLDRAIRLYENFGFRRIEERPRDLFGTPLFSMERLIDQNLSWRTSGGKPTFLT